MNAIRLDISSTIAAAQKNLVGAEPWLIDYSDKQDLKNNQLPSSLRTNPINIYALWKRESGEAWQLMYIGERKFESGWSRIEQHLFSTPKSTQSKLLEVKAVIESGAEIGITAILVEPDSMRLTIEEELIKRNSMSAEHLIWNRKGRAKLPKIGIRPNADLHVGPRGH